MTARSPDPAAEAVSALREAGQTAYEARFAGRLLGPRGVSLAWRDLPEDDRAIWVGVEAACAAPLLADIAALRTERDEARAALQSEWDAIDLALTEGCGTNSPRAALIADWIGRCAALDARADEAERSATAAHANADENYRRLTAATADRDRLAEENARLKAAVGCHVQADAYRDSFPDNDQDAAHNRKSETWWRLMARCAVPQNDQLHEACSVAAMSMPEVVTHRDSVIAKVSAEFGA